MFEDLGYAAQQAAEKAIKAVFVKLKQPFPFTHNLDRLLGILRQMKIPIPDEVSRAGTLTPYALDVRYPGLSNETTEGDYREAVAIAEAVVGWAAGVVGSPEKE